MNLIVVKKTSLYSQFTFLPLKKFKVLPLFNNKFNLKLPVQSALYSSNKIFRRKAKKKPLGMNLTGSKEIVLHTKSK